MSSQRDELSEQPLRGERNGLEWLGRVNEAIRTAHDFASRSIGGKGMGTQRGMHRLGSMRPTSSKGKGRKE